MAETFQLPSLKSIPQDLVDSTIAMLITRLSEYNPDIDFNRKAAFTLIPYLHGLLLAGTSSELIDQLATNNLASVLDGTATDEQTDEVCKAFGITRRAAKSAEVSALFVLSSAVPFALSAADIISFGNTQFSVTSSVNIRASSATIASGTDFVLTQIGTGKWGVVIPLTAKATGSASNLPAGTSLTSSKTISSLVKITVTETLQSGAEQETNSQMAARVLAASSIKTWASRSSFEAIARQGDTYPDLVAVSVTGFGDPEQRRDRRGVLPVSHGGRTDVWMKFRPGLFSAQEQVSAVLTAKTGAIGTWSFTVNGQDFPAVYRVAYVSAVDDQSGDTFIPSSETWSLGVPVNVVLPIGSDDRYVPDIQSSQEAAFSAYINDTVIFDDYRYDVTSLTVGETRDYLATVYYEPLVDTFQQELGSLASSNPGGDVVVRSAIPCEVSATVSISVYQGKTAPDSQSVLSAVLDYINATGFTGSISASDISSAVGRVVNGVGTIVVNYLAGRLRKPDGSYLSFTMQDGKIQVPDLPDEMVTGNTVAFYSDASKVSVIIQ